MPRSRSYAHSSAVRAGDGELVIRPARPADSDALAVLAALDSARPLSGDRVVAEAGGRPVAAISLDDGHAIADPFVPSAGAVEILRLHAAAARGAAKRARRRLPRLAPRGLAPKIA